MHNTPIHAPNLTDRAPLEAMRSLLFVPAADAKKIEKAEQLDCDGVIYDLEDSVFNDVKSEALSALIDYVLSQPLKKGRYVRLNVRSGQREAQRLKHLVQSGHLSGFVLPKVEMAHALLPIHDMGVAFFAMIETPLGVVNLRDICTQSPHLKGLIFGPNDMRFCLNSHDKKSRDAFNYALSAIIMHARAFGLLAIDGVYNHFKDQKGFEEEAHTGRAFGFDGKSLIHPSQIEAANRIFGPTDDEKAWANRLVAAYDKSPNQAIITIDGEMFELMHLARAMRILQLT